MAQGKNEENEKKKKYKWKIIMQAVYNDDKKKEQTLVFIFIYIKRYLNAKNTALCFNQFFIVFSSWCLFKLILHVLLLLFFY